MVDVRARLGAIGEHARGLKDDVGAGALPAELGQVFFGSDQDTVAIDYDVAAVDAYGPSEAPMHRVVLQEVRQRRGVGQVVDGDDLDALALRIALPGSNHAATDATKAIDANANCHGDSSASVTMCLGPDCN